MTSQTEQQYLAEANERAVARIKGVTEKTGHAPSEFNKADTERLNAAFWNIPMVGMSADKVDGKNVEDLALIILEYGKAYAHALREVDLLRQENNLLKGEKKAFRRFIGTEQ